MLPSFATQTVHVETGVLGPDYHGNRVADFTNTTSRDIPGCSIQPGATREDRDHRDAALIAYTVWAPPGTVIDPIADRVVIGGRPFAVMGLPEVWATGVLDYVRFSLTAWEG